MSSGRRRQSLKPGTIIKILIFIAILAVVILAGMNFSRKKVDKSMKSTEENAIQSATVTTGNISTTVSGSGTLSYAGLFDRSAF